MTSIRFRLFLLMTTAFALTASFGYLTILSYINQQQLHSQLQLSYMSEATVRKIHIGSTDKDLIKQMQLWRAQLSPEARTLAWSDVIQAYTDKNQRLFKKRSRFYLKNEVEYRKWAEPQVKYQEGRIKYNGLISFGSAILSILVLFYYIQISVFKPLRGLSRRMSDFLDDKYSYKFVIPPKNEVGTLQASFNSMAQRVLNNMEELRSLDRAKSDFLSIASHELRTPLTSIKGSLSLLGSGNLGEFSGPTKSLLSIAQTETDRLIRLINDLLDLAKIEARKFPLNKDWNPLRPLLQQTIESINGLAQQAAVKLEIGEVPSMEVFMDSDKIQQVLTNLLSNAIKYSPPTSVVYIHLDVTEDECLAIEVSDQGRGIHPDDQEFIFQQFRQATGPKNPLVKGTGLGLAIAKALVEGHEGQIGVRSTPGHGSTFYFTLPKWRFSLSRQQNGKANTTQVAA